ncbi:hypothetical protein ABN789_005197 [Salmonella enterica]
MIQPYHPLTHQSVDSPGDNKLTKQERQELTDISVLLISRVVRMTVGCFAFLFFFCVTLFICG